MFVLKVVVAYPLGGCWSCVVVGVGVGDVVVVDGVGLCRRRCWCRLRTQQGQAQGSEVGGEGADRRLKYLGEVVQTKLQNEFHAVGDNMVKDVRAVEDKFTEANN